MASRLPTRATIQAIEAAVSRWLRVTASAEPTPSLKIRVECASEDAALVARLQKAVTDAFRERLGVAADVEMLARGALPRFDYKAARVVSA